MSSRAISKFALRNLEMARYQNGVETYFNHVMQSPCRDVRPDLNSTFSTIHPFLFSTQFLIGFMRKRADAKLAQWQQSVRASFPKELCPGPTFSPHLSFKKIDGGFHEIHVPNTTQYGYNPCKDERNTKKERRDREKRDRRERRKRERSQENPKLDNPKSMKSLNVNEQQQTSRLQYIMANEELRNCTGSCPSDKLPPPVKNERKITNKLLAIMEHDQELPEPNPNPLELPRLKEGIKSARPEYVIVPEERIERSDGLKYLSSRPWIPRIVDY
jgi:hypothetical protein